MTMCEEQISEAGSEQCPSQMARRNKKSNQSAESATNGSASKSISVRNERHEQERYYHQLGIEISSGVLMMKRGSDITRLNKLVK